MPTAPGLECVLTGDMRLKELMEDGVDVFALEGEIDLHHSPSLRSLLQSKIKTGCPALILDLARVVYIDSSGLAVIMEYVREAMRHRTILCLAALRPEVKTIFELIRLDKMIPIFASASEAAAAVKANKVQPPAGIFDCPQPDV